MFKLKIVILSLIFNSFFSLYSQVNIKIKIFVINENYEQKFSRKNVKKNSNYKLKATDFYGENLHFLVSYANDTSKQSENSAFCKDFKIKCVLRYNFFRRKVIYFTRSGNYYLNGAFYKKDKLYEFIYYKYLSYMNKL